MYYIKTWFLVLGVFTVFSVGRNATANPIFEEGPYATHNFKNGDGGPTIQNGDGGWKRQALGPYHVSFRAYRAYFGFGPLWFEAIVVKNRPRETCVLQSYLEDEGELDAAAYTQKSEMACETMGVSIAYQKTQETCCSCNHYGYRDNGEVMVTKDGVRHVLNLAFEAEGLKGEQGKVSWVYDTYQPRCNPPLNNATFDPTRG